MLSITAALRRLAGDTSAIAASLAEFAGRRRQRFSCEADFYQWIYPIVADLFFTATFGLERGAQPVRFSQYGTKDAGGSAVRVYP
jgi:hypothetical protein